MALAILRQDDERGEGIGFTFDIGKNRYWTLAVGAKRRRGGSGLEVVDEVGFSTSLEGPLPASALGRGRLLVPVGAFDREQRLVQLASYRDPERRGPALSEIVELNTAIGRLPRSDELPDLALPRRFARDLSRRTGVMARTIPIRYREGRLSEAAGIEAIGSLLQTILPQVTQAVDALAPAIERLAPAVGDLLGGAARMAPAPATRGAPSGTNGPAAPANGGATAAPPRPPAAAPGNRDPLGALLSRLTSDPETIRLLRELLEQVAAANQAPAVPAQAQGLRQKLKRARGLSSRPSHARAQAVPLAALAPMLLQAAPALAPLLEKVVNPDTLKAVLDAPNRHLGTIINGIKDVANLAIQSHEQDLAHLRAIHPNLDDPALDALLASMSLGLSQAAREEPAYKRVAAVRLTIPDGPLVLMNGIELPAYRLGADWQIPLEVVTPRPVPEARLHVVVKDAQSLEILFRKTADLGDVPAGPLSDPVHLGAQELSPLKPGHRYLLCMHLIWRNRNGAARGTSIQQELLSIGALAFDRLEPEGEPIPLAAIERFRPFWHKVWSGRFERDVRRVILDIKYLITLDPEARENARMETRMRLVDGPGRREGRLKSGIVLSLPDLVRLRQELEPEAEPLTPEMLDALAVPAFADGYSLAARKMVKLHGGEGKSAALWTYPEMKLARVVLLDPRGVDDSGRVSELGEMVITVPKPALLHFVGVRT